MFLSKSQESIADGFIEKLVSWAKNIKVSDPLEEGCRLGPVASLRAGTSCYELDFLYARIHISES